MEVSRRARKVARVMLARRTKSLGPWSLSGAPSICDGGGGAAGTGSAEMWDGAAMAKNNLEITDLKPIKNEETLKESQETKWLWSVVI
jgi:hypothetical protein